MASLADILKGGLQDAIDVRILKETAEIGGERSEGRSEFANPHTVPQPVHQSQLPGGQPLNFLGSNTGLLLLLGGGGLLAVLLLVIALR